MNKLTKDYWYKFKNDGKLFEKLVDELLRAMFPRATFTHTTWSHDGGKDFVYGFPFFDEELKIWAECKFHKKALPIHDVSMTLFMAYIEAASTIIFFSYSPINSNFQKYIDLYKKKSNKQIKIYADISLENLILKYKDQIHFEDFFDISQDFTITNVFSPEIYKYWLHTDRKINKKYYTFHLNDVIKLEFSVFNQTSKPLTLSIEMKNNNDFLFFEVLDTTFVKNGYKETIEIPPNGVNGKTLLLKIKRYQPFLKLPFLIVDNGIKKRTLRISKSIFCRWLAETTIKGKKYKNLIKGAEELLALDRKSILCIVGRSGTGKSRVIKEIATTAVSMNYTYINVDADISRRLTADSFFKNIVAHFEDLPEISHLSKKQIKYLGDNSEQIDQIALDILFKRDIDYKAIHDELVCYLKKIFLKEHIFLCLENIQFYDESIINIIQEVVNTLHDYSISKLVISANLDYVLSSSPVSRLLNSLEQYSRKQPEYYTYHRVEGFSKTDASEYLTECLQNSSDYPDEFNYPASIEQIVINYGTNPFFLQNYLLYLAEKQIITRTKTSSFFIADCEAFKESLQQIPSDVFGLLKYREDFLISHFLNSDEQYKVYYTFISYLVFAKWLPLRIIRRLCDISDKVLQHMLDMGFIKINSEGNYGFYHKYIEAYYENKYPFTKINDSALEKYISILSSSYEKETYIESIFLAQFYLEKVNKATFSKIINNICHYKLDFYKTYNVCDAVSRLILVESKDFNIETGQLLTIY